MWDQELSDDAKAELAAVFADLKRRYASISGVSVFGLHHGYIGQDWQRRWHLK